MFVTGVSFYTIRGVSAPKTMSFNRWLGSFLLIHGGNPVAQALFMMNAVRVYGEMSCRYGNGCISKDVRQTMRITDDVSPFVVSMAGAYNFSYSQTVSYLFTFFINGGDKVENWF